MFEAVHNASWSAGYDIRVDMQAKDEPVTLVYKAGITQDTGEVGVLFLLLVCSLHM